LIGWLIVFVFVFEERECRFGRVEPLFNRCVLFSIRLIFFFFIVSFSSFFLLFSFYSLHPHSPSPNEIRPLYYDTLVFHLIPHCARNCDNPAFPLDLLYQLLIFQDRSRDQSHWITSWHEHKDSWPDEYYDESGNFEWKYTIAKVWKQ
jgi:hypothetical protein